MEVHLGVEDVLLGGDSPLASSGEPQVERQRGFLEQKRGFSARTGAEASHTLAVDTTVCPLNFHFGQEKVLGVEDVLRGGSSPLFSSGDPQVER